VRRDALADRVCGLLMFGFDGTAPEDVPGDLIARAAGAILFARNLVNPVQARALIDSIAGASGDAARPLVAIDEEGGPVSHLSAVATPMPSAMAMAAAGDLQLTQRAYAAIGRELAALGFNLDLAPVADLNDEPRNPIIGLRSFGDQPDRVSDHVAAAIRGLHAAGIAAIAKHFPGHGSTVEDSHLGLPVVEFESERTRAAHLAPFRAAVAAGADAVMTAHVAFPALDPSGSAATLSRPIIDGVLRSELGFDGVVCSDAMEMRAVAGAHDPASAALAALDAGVDVLLYGNVRDARSALDGLRAAAFDGSLAQERIDRSLDRITRLRERLGPRPREAPETDQDCRALAADIARRAITLVRDSGRLLPLRLAAGTRLFVANFSETGSKSTARVSSVIGKALAASGARVQEQQRELDPAGHGYKQLLMAATASDAIIAVTRSLAMHPLQARAASDLALLGKPLVVVAAREPYDAAFVPDEASVVASFGDSGLALEAAADVLLGRSQARGSLPVDVRANVGAGS